MPIAKDSADQARYSSDSGVKLPRGRGPSSSNILLPPSQKLLPGFDPARHPLYMPRNAPVGGLTGCLPHPCRRQKVFADDPAIDAQGHRRVAD